MLLKYTLYTYLFLFFTFTISAQSGKLKFDYLTTNDGLSQASVLSILQDDEGFMWFGTRYGLNKYNGYTFTKYYHEPNNTTSIPADLIESLFEDSHKNIWIGTRNGFCQYDRKHDTFINFYNRPNYPDNFKGVYIHCIYEDSKGNYWIGADKGLLKYDPSKDTYKVFITNEKDNTSINNNEVHAVLEDVQGNIWLGTEGGGLNCYHPKTNQFTHYLHQENNPKSLSNDDIYGLVKDKAGTLWIGTYGGGICRLNKLPDGNYSFDNFKPKTNDGRRFKVLALLSDHKNGLWIGNENGGLDYFDIHTATFTNYQYDEKKLNSLNCNSIKSIYIDRTDNMWIGTYTNGINIYKSRKKKIDCFKKFPFYANSLSNDVVTNFYEAGDGSLWIATDGGGLNILNRNSGEYKHFNMTNSEFQSDAILAVNADASNNIWVGGWETGLNLYDGKNKKFIHLSREKFHFPNDDVFVIFCDSKGRLWISFGGAGFAKFNYKNNTLKLYSDLGNHITANSNWVYDIKEDKYGNILVGHLDGLSIFNPEKETFVNYMRPTNSTIGFNDNEINTLYVGHDSVIWIGTYSGLKSLNEKTGQFNRYTTKEGLPSNDILGIVEDKHYNLWISTNNGIAQFLHKSHTFKIYNREDGLQGNCFQRNSCYLTRKGELLFGGDNGFNAFFPDSLFSNPNLPNVAISDFFIFNQHITSNSKDSPLKSAINEADKIVLSYNQSVISFEFAALEFTSPFQNQYKYKLEGFDKNWNHVGTSRIATYTNLDPGEYTLRVSASNNDLKWTTKDKLLKIVIEPPWWKTSLATVCFILFIICSSLGFYLYRVNSLKKQKKNLEKKVEEKTMELIESNNEIEQKNVMLIHQANQLNETNTQLEERQMQIEEQDEELIVQKDALLKQRDQLNELNNTKDKLFSILSHDLRAPFNSILGFSELLSSQARNYSIDKIERQAFLIRNTARNTFDMLNNLLEWARSQRGFIQFVPEHILVSKILMDELNILRNQSDQKEINITWDFIGNEFPIELDPNLISIVIRNLISNAIKFSNKKNSIQITLQFQTDLFTFSVKDEGLGISADDIEKLFKFNTAASTRGTEGEKGMGLGLLICVDFIEQHRGRIWVKSEKGKGSTFSFSIPVIQTST